MAIAERPTHHIEVRLGRTLAPARRRRRPYRAATKAAAQIALLATAVVVMLQHGPDSIGLTLFFGAAALLYLMADFVLELPTTRHNDQVSSRT